MDSRKIKKYLRQLENGELSSDREESDCDDLDYYPTRDALEAELEGNIENGDEVDDVIPDITQGLSTSNANNIDPPLINNSATENSSFVAPSTRGLYGNLAGEGIHTLGTAQRNRLGKECKLMTKEQILKQARGTFEENMTSVNGVDITALAWIDNKPVTLASTYVGVSPVGQIQRYDKKEKKKVTIACPNLVKEYNAHMGGVDVMDSYLGRYRIRMKSRKWYMRIFYHLLHLTVINAWVLYKKVAMEKRESPKNILKLEDFRAELADTCVTPPPTRGRPASIEDTPRAKKIRKGVISQQKPPRELRLDGFGHDQKRGDIRK